MRMAFIDRKEHVTPSIQILHWDLAFFMKSFGIQLLPKIHLPHSKCLIVQSTP